MVRHFGRRHAGRVVGIALLVLWMAGFGVGARGPAQAAAAAGDLPPALTLLAQADVPAGPAEAGTTNSGAGTTNEVKAAATPTAIQMPPAKPGAIQLPPTKAGTANPKTGAGTSGLAGFPAPVPSISGGASGTEPTGNGLVTNVFMDTDLRQALADIASQTGQIIVVGPTVQGMVSCDLKDVPLEKALKIVLSVGDYTWKQMDGFILVGSNDPESPTFSVFSETRLVKLDNIAASSAVAMLSSSLQKYAKASEGGSSRPALSAPTPDASKDPLKYSPSPLGSMGGGVGGGGSGAYSDTVLIIAPPVIADRIEAILKQMDRAPRQVMLEARMVVIENSNFSDMGVQWTFPTVAAGAFSDSFQHEKGALGGGWPWGLQIGYTPSKTFTNSLLLTLNLLAQNNDATVMANPKVVAVEGKESQLSVTSEEYFQILTQGFYTNSELEKIDSGTTLRITPRVAKDGKIMLEMRAEVSDVVSRGASNLPVVSRRIAQSTVGVEDGGTAVVAGLLDNRTRDEQDHVPFMGRIPFIGRLFRNDARTNTQRQVAMFVTARLVPSDDSVAKQSEPHERIAPVDAEAFRAELAQYLYASPVAWNVPDDPIKGNKAPKEAGK